MSRLSADKKHSVSFTLNGQNVTGLAEPRMLLTDFLRAELGMTGTHVGCEHGVCGACTIQIDGKMARACLALAVQTQDCDVRTVEGLSDDGARLSILQEAFREHHGLQCGFCTAGFLMTVDAFLKEKPDAREDEIRDVLSGHLCRCTGYAPIINAVLAAQKKLQAERLANTEEINA